MVKLVNVPRGEFCEIAMGGKFRIKSGKLNLNVDLINDQFYGLIFIPVFDTFSFFLFFFSSWKRVCRKLMKNSWKFSIKTVSRSRVLVVCGLNGLIDDFYVFISMIWLGARAEVISWQLLSIHFYSNGNGKVYFRLNNRIFKIETFFSTVLWISYFNSRRVFLLNFI